MSDVGVLGLALLALWFGLEAVDRLVDHLSVRWRVRLGRLDLEDPRTEETIKEAYTRGRISMEEMERRLAVVVDPRAEQLQRTLETVSGIGPSIAWSVAEQFQSERDLATADVDDLQDVPGVGPKRARAIRERVQS